MLCSQQYAFVLLLHSVCDLATQWRTGLLVHNRPVGLCRQWVEVCARLARCFSDSLVCLFYPARMLKRWHVASSEGARLAC